MSDQLVTTRSGNKAHIRDAANRHLALCGAVVGGTADMEQVERNPWLRCQRCRYYQLKTIRLSPKARAVAARVQAARLGKA